MPDDLQTPGPGHNNPPEDIFTKIAARTDQCVANANRWVNERPEITSEEEAEKAADFLRQLRDLGTGKNAEIEAARKAAKQPHLDAAAAVDAQYNPLKRKVEISIDLVKKLLGPWIDKKERERQERERLAREEAERKRREAEEAAKAAEQQTGDVVGARLAAEDAAKEAEAAAKAAKKVANTKATVGSGYSGQRAVTSRTYYKVEITDVVKIGARALRILCAKPYVQEALIRALREDIAFARTLDGVQVTEERRVA